MKLPEEEAKLFIDLMCSLQYFVNGKLKIHAQIKSIEAYAECTTEEKAEVRKALFSDIKRIDSFVQENPQNFSQEKLSIVSNWKNFIEGDFQIERFLKSHAIFIQENDVYCVLGLYQGFDELIHRSRLPLYVKAILLPFKGKIVYDGIFQTYNIHFGGGIKRSLKETYMTAKQNNRIIESLDDTPKQTQIKNQPKPSKNWKPELEKLASTAKNLRASSESPTIYSPAFSLVKASIELAQHATADSDDVEALYNSLKKVERALNKSRTVLERDENW